MTVPLSTARLELRPWRPEDAAAVVEIFAFPEVLRNLGDPAHPSTPPDLARAERTVAKWSEIGEPEGRGFWAVTVAGSDRVVGGILLLTLDPLTGESEQEDVEVGWWLHPEVWGHGYATEAGQAALQHAWDSDLPRVYAVTHAGNEGSMNVCRKLGMRHEGLQQTPWFEGPMELFVVESPGGSA
jgi:RimJ/RimL family protein N-acetyltransferase